MSSVLNFDELNTLESKPRSEPYEQYFDKMSLTKKEKKLRIAFSNDMEDAILYILSLAGTMVDNEQIDETYIQNQLFDRYMEIAAAYMAVDSYIKDYIRMFSEQITKTTLEHSTDPYYFSNDRARFISECEANTSLNYKQYIDAIKAGKKYKTWIDIGDSRERETHREVGGTTIPIEDTFSVGGSLMLFPKDTSLGASSSEIVNCRCSVRYS